MEVVISVENERGGREREGADNLEVVGPLLI